MGRCYRVCSRSGDRRSAAVPLHQSDCQCVPQRTPTKTAYYRVWGSEFGFSFWVCASTILVCGSVCAVRERCGSTRGFGGVRAQERCGAKGLRNAAAGTRRRARPHRRAPVCASSRTFVLCLRDEKLLLAAWDTIVVTIDEPQVPPLGLKPSVGMTNHKGILAAAPEGAPLQCWL